MPFRIQPYMVFPQKRLKHIFLASRLFRGNKVDAPVSLLELFPVV